MLGKRLKMLRGKRTQEEVAKHLGISRARYSHYENSRSEPDIETLQQLAKFFGVSTDYLINGTENKATSMIKVAGQEIELTEEEYKVFQEMKKHPSFQDMLQDLASDPERKVKKLIKMWELINTESE